MRVFKYRGANNFSRDVESLENNMFYAAPLSKLNDPAEGFVNKINLMTQIDALVAIYLKENTSSEKLKKSIENLLEFRDKSGIYSLSKVKNDELLWSYYGESHKGFCIEYDYKKLFSFEKREGSLRIDVFYSSSIPTLGSEDLDNKQQFIQKIIGTKSEKWSYESESRILTSKLGDHEYDFRAVKAIYFGLRMSSENKDVLMEKLQGREIEYYQMKHSAGSYNLVAEKVVDKFSNSKKYKYHIAPIASAAVQPELINEKWEKYKGYLNKVAEIIRREPYCNLVEMVEISVEKSSDSTPVFFGQYERKKFRPETLYYSVDEVDKLYGLIEDLNNGK